MSIAISYEEVKVILGSPIIDTIVTREQYDAIAELAGEKAEEFKRDFIVQEMEKLYNKLRNSHYPLGCNNENRIR